MILCYWLPDRDRTLLCEDPASGEWWMVPHRRDGWYERERYALADVWVPERWAALAGDVANVALALCGAPHDVVTLDQCQAYVAEIARCHAAMARIDARKGDAYPRPAIEERTKHYGSLGAIQARIAELARGVA